MYHVTDQWSDDNTLNLPPPPFYYVLGTQLEFSVYIGKASMWERGQGFNSQ